jgi:hypothetical protein
MIEGVDRSVRVCGCLAGVCGMSSWEWNGLQRDRPLCPAPIRTLGQAYTIPFRPLPLRVFWLGRKACTFVCLPQPLGLARHAALSQQVFERRYPSSLIGFGLLEDTIRLSQLRMCGFDGCQVVLEVCDMIRSSYCMSSAHVCVEGWEQMTQRWMMKRQSNLVMMTVEFGED